MSDVVSHIRVAVAIIEQQGRYLITQRRLTDVLAGLWEFPSSKVETGDTDEAALRRELRERVGVAADVGDVIAHCTHRSDGCVVDLVLYRATIPPTKQPRPLRMAELRWVAPHELENYAFPPADQVTTDLLLKLTMMFARVGNPNVRPIAEKVDAKPRQVLSAVPNAYLAASAAAAAPGSVTGDSHA